MSAETLRRAAALMREDHPLSVTHDSTGCGAPVCRGRMYHHAVADWLDDIARNVALVESGVYWNTNSAWLSSKHCALAVARAYLGDHP